MYSIFSCMSGRKMTLDVSLSCLVGNTYRYVTTFSKLKLTILCNYKALKKGMALCQLHLVHPKMFSKVNSELAKMANAVVSMLLPYKLFKSKELYYRAQL